MQRGRTVKKILIVDDEPHLRLLYEIELRRLGYSTLAAENASQCLEFVETMNPDLVILDIRMPGMDGVDTLHHILNRKPEIPVILNTAYSSCCANYLTWAADACLRKSSDLTELTETVKNLLPQNREKEKSPKSTIRNKPERHERPHNVELHQ